MGMSAAQARLLSLTTRMNNNEFRSQTITNSKLRLADKSSDASQEYMNALNSQQLMFGSYNSDGKISYQQLTPGIIMTFSDLKNQYGLINSAGKILVSGTDAKNYEQSDTLIDFLRRSNVEFLPVDYEKLANTDILQYAGDLLKSEFRCWSGTGISGLTFGNTSFHSGYVQHQEHVLASLLWDNSETGSQTMTVTDGTHTETITKYGNTVTDNPSLSDKNVPLGGMYALKTFVKNADGTYTGVHCGADGKESTVKFAKSVDENGNQKTRDFIIDGTTYTALEWKRQPDGYVMYTTFPATDSSYFDANGAIDNTKTGATINAAHQVTDAKIPGYYTNYQKTGETRLNMYILNDVGFGLTTESQTIFNDKYNLKGILAEDEDLLNKLKLDYYRMLAFLDSDLAVDNNCANWGGIEGTDRTTAGGGLKLGTITNSGALTSSFWDESYYNSLTGTAKEDYRKKAAANMVDEFTKTMNELTIKTVCDIYTSNDGRMDLLKKLDGFKELNAAVEDVIEVDAGDSSYQWYVNLWYRMGGTSETTKSSIPNYKELDENLMNNSEWLQFALEHGIVTLEQAAFSEEGSQQYPKMGQFDWKSMIYTNASDISLQDDSVAIARAEVKYNNAMREIENQDKKFDQDLKKLDTEHSALQTEYESLKSVIDKNVDRSFKAFS